MHFIYDFANENKYEIQLVKLIIKTLFATENSES